MSANNGTIPQPPAWAMALAWVDEEIAVARKLRNAAEAKKDEEKRIYYEARYATLIETRLHMKGVLL